MLALKRGIPSFSRASSSHHVLPVVAPPPHRLYSDDSKKSNETLTLLDALSTKNPARKPDSASDPFAKHLTGENDKKTISDLLSYRLPQAPKNRKSTAPRLAPAPLAAPGPMYTSPRRTGLAGSGNDDSPPMSFEKTGGRGARTNMNPLTQSSVVSSSTSVNYRLYVTARKHNCLMTLIDENANPRASVSSGQCGFRNVGEGTYEAGYQCALRIFDRIRAEVQARREDVKLEIFINGFGQSRMALLKALSMSEGEGVRDVVTRLTDKTPIRIGGVRLQKKRR
ncbi:hypothetical protein DFH11DRAFT_337639 [Phellopilus nigrolimitatus]|nr:hypothetical protein DFH11DRAFT_337639 [Phellopilus nigrolimitatus]